MTASYKGKLGKDAVIKQLQDTVDQLKRENEGNRGDSGSDKLEKLIGKIENGFGYGFTGTV